MLRLKVIRARLSHDTETFGKMDPYFQVQLDKKKIKTKTHDKGGKEP
jgi:Ca2+-dependent lipid-binding protein